jgi:hypothetical protein
VDETIRTRAGLCQPHPGGAESMGVSALTMELVACIISYIYQAPLINLAFPGYSVPEDAVILA